MTRIKIIRQNILGEPAHFFYLVSMRGRINALNAGFETAEKEEVVELSI